MNDRLENRPNDHSANTNVEQPIEALDTKGNPIELLLEQLDFHASQELKDATTAIIEGLIDSDADESQLKLAWTEYAKIAEQIVESVEVTPEDPKAYAKAQIAAIIHKALVFLSAEHTLRYLEELDRAEIYAYHEHLDEMSAAITDEITATIELFRSFEHMSPEILILKLKGVISEDNREFLRDLMGEGDDFEDMVNHAYGMILEEGSDPDEILAELGIINRE